MEEKIKRPMRSIEEILFESESLSKNEDDFLSRREEADRLFQAIEDQRIPAGTRIWIYWEWGSWKTVFLNLIRQVADKHKWLLFKKYKCFNYILRDHETFRELKRDFLMELYEQIPLVFKCFFFVVCLLVTLPICWWATNSLNIPTSFIRGIVATVTSALFVKAIPGIFQLLIRLAPFSSVAGNIRESINVGFLRIYFALFWLMGKRFILIVDDMDRYRRGSLSDLFMWISDILKLYKENFYVFFSLDPVMVGNNIGNAFDTKDMTDNAWYLFLEKIIDIPHFLSELSVAKKVLFWNSIRPQMLQSSEHFSGVDILAEFLPSNPRKIKRFLRAIHLFSKEFERYESREVHFPTVFLFVLLRLEYPLEYREIAGMMKLVNITDFISGDKKKFTQALSKYEGNPQLYTLLNAFRDKIIYQSLWSLSKLDQSIDFFESAPIFTEKEFSMHISNDKVPTLLDLVGKISDPLERICFLGNQLESRYSNLVDAPHRVDMLLLQKQITGKIYPLLTKEISRLPKNQFIPQEIFNSILASLTRYSNFNEPDNSPDWSIDYPWHRAIEKKLISSFISKTDPITAYQFLYNSTVAYWPWRTSSAELFQLYSELLDPIWEIISRKILSAFLDWTFNADSFWGWGLIWHMAVRTGLLKNVATHIKNFPGNSVYDFTTGLIFGVKNQNLNRNILESTYWPKILKRMPIAKLNRRHASTVNEYIEWCRVEIEKVRPAISSPEA